MLNPLLFFAVVLFTFNQSFVIGQGCTPTSSPTATNPAVSYSISYIDDPFHFNSACPCTIRPSLRIMAVLPALGITDSYNVRVIKQGMLQAARDLDVTIAFVPPPTDAFDPTYILDQYQLVFTPSSAANLFSINAEQHRANNNNIPSSPYSVGPSRGVLLPLQLSDITTPAMSYLINNINSETTNTAHSQAWSTVSNKTTFIGSYGGGAAFSSKLGLDFSVGPDNYGVGVAVARRFLNSANLPNASTTSFVCVPYAAGSLDAVDRCSGYCDTVKSIYSSNNLPIPSCTNLVNIDFTKAASLVESYILSQLYPSSSSTVFPGFIFTGNAELANYIHTALLNYLPNHPSIPFVPRMATVDVSPYVASLLVSHISNPIVTSPSAVQASTSLLEFAVDLQPHFQGYMSVLLMALRIQTSGNLANKALNTGPVLVDGHSTYPVPPNSNLDTSLLTHAHRESAGFPVCDDGASIAIAAAVGELPVPCLNRTGLNFIISDHLRNPSTFGAFVKTGYHRASLDMRVNVSMYALNIVDPNVQANNILLAYGSPYVNPSLIESLPGATDASKRLLGASLPLNSVPNGIITSMAYPAPLMQAINNLTYNGALQNTIPIVAINSGYNDPKVESYPLLAYVGQDEFNAGKALATLQVNSQSSKGNPVKKAVCLNAGAGTITHDTRCAGYMAGMTSFGINSTMYTLNIADSTLTTNDFIAYYHAGYNAFLTTNGGVITPILTTLNHTFGPTVLASLSFVSFDTYADEYNDINLQDLLAIVDQQTYLQGYLPVSLLALYWITSGNKFYRTFDDGTSGEVVYGANMNNANSLNRFVTLQSGPAVQTSADQTLATCAQAYSSESSDGFYNTQSYPFTIYAWPVCQEIITINTPTSSIISSILSDNSKIALTIITSILIFLVLLTMALIFYYRHHRVIHSAAPTFLYIMCTGLIAIFTSLLFRVYAANASHCEVSLWLYNIGVCIAVCSLSGKTYRIYVIFSTKILQNVRLTDGHLLIVLFCATVTTIILLAIHTGSSTFYYTWDPIHNQCVSGGSGSDHGSTSNVIITLLTILQAIYLAIGAFMSYLVKGMPSFFHEGPYLSLCTYNSLFVGALYLFVRYYAIDTTTSQVSITIAECIFILFVGGCTLLLIMTPKLFVVLSQPHNVRKSGASAISSQNNYGGVANSNVSYLDPLSPSAAKKFNDKGKSRTSGNATSKTNGSQDNVSPQDSSLPAQMQDPVARALASPLVVEDGDSEAVGPLLTIDDLLGIELESVQKEYDSHVNKVKRLEKELAQAREKENASMLKRANAVYERQYINDLGQGKTVTQKRRKKDNNNNTPASPDRASSTSNVGSPNNKVTRTTKAKLGNGSIAEVLGVINTSSSIPENGTGSALQVVIASDPVKSSGDSSELELETIPNNVTNENNVTTASRPVVKIHMGDVNKNNYV